MAEPIVVWTDKTVRLIQTPDDQYILEQIAPDKDALGNEHWLRIQLTNDLFVTICRAIFGQHG